jgi:aminoglycoside 6'-N-acetyltransferase
MSSLELTGGVSIAADAPGGGEIRLRWAHLSDKAVLERWDYDPDVIAATTDGEAEKAFGDHDWGRELPKQSDVDRYFIAEWAASAEDVDARPVGAMQVIDAAREPTHYWGDVAENQMAVDIWIGDPADRGRGYGSVMMKMAEMLCFSDPRITAIIIDPLNSNTDAHRFYQRLGYRPTHRQTFNGEDDCLVHILTRDAWNARAKR